MTRPLHHRCYLASAVNITYTPHMLTVTVRITFASPISRDAVGARCRRVYFVTSRATSPLTIRCLSRHLRRLCHFCSSRLTIHLPDAVAARSNTFALLLTNSSLYNAADAVSRAFCRRLTSSLNRPHAFVIVVALLQILFPRIDDLLTLLSTLCVAFHVLHIVLL